MKALTPMELKILSLISAGRSTNEVAKDLGMSKYTVISHRRSLLLKLDASNSAELVRKAMELNSLRILNSENESDTL